MFWKIDWLSKKHKRALNRREPEAKEHLRNMREARQKDGGKKISIFHFFAPIFLPVKRSVEVNV